MLVVAVILLALITCTVLCWKKLKKPNTDDVEGKSQGLSLKCLFDVASGCVEFGRMTSANSGVSFQLYNIIFNGIPDYYHIWSITAFHMQK